MQKNILVKSLIGIIIILISGCNSITSIKSFGDVSDIVEEYNSGNKSQRFKNSKMYFRNTLTLNEKERLSFKANNENAVKTQFFKMSAYIRNEEDGMIGYFLYGTSKKDSILSEFRIRSLQNGKIIEDFLIVDLLSNKDLSYDYQIDKDNLVLKAQNRKGETHHSIFCLKSGELINKTIIPDTIFRRQDLEPDQGRRVVIFTDFQSKTLKIQDEDIIVTGVIEKKYRGVDCLIKMIIKLDDNPSMSFNYIQTASVVNNLSDLHGLESDVLIQVEDQCLKIAHQPKTDPEFILSNVYVEYY